MKTILPVLILMLVLAACSSNPSNKVNREAGIISVTDTLGLAEYNASKKAAIASQDAVKTVVREVPVRQTRVAAKQTPMVYESRTSESENAALPAEKKGWSKAAKGAVIGAGTGAAAGAVIHKRNRVVGGVVGGVVGAGAGYGIGRHMDKKDGRY